MGTLEVPEVETDYTRYSNRQLAAVPIAVLAVALLVLGGAFLVYGSPVPLGMDFAGGAQLTVETTSSEAQIQEAFSVEPDSIQAVQAPGADNQYTVQFAGVEDDEVIQSLSAEAEDNLDPVSGNEDSSIVKSESTTSASFAEQAQQTALLGVAVAFVGMSVIAFLLFRTFVPSIAIVISAFSDVIIPLAFMSVAGISLSLGTVAALLMLIGYSVDSDILLNNHVLRRQGDFYESTHRAMRTGITMTITSMMAMLVMGITASLFGVELLASIGIILFVGLAADLMNTYMLNVSLLRWYKFHGVRS